MWSQAQQIVARARAECDVITPTPTTDNRHRNATPNVRTHAQRVHVFSQHIFWVRAFIRAGTNIYFRDLVLALAPIFSPAASNSINSADAVRYTSDQRRIIAFTLGDRTHRAPKTNTERDERNPVATAAGKLQCA